MVTSDDLHFRAGHPVLGYARSAARSRRVPWIVLAVSIAALDGLLLMLLAVGVGDIYHILVGYHPQPLTVHFRLGAAIGIIVVAVAALMGNYRLAAIVREPSHPGRLAGAFLFSMAVLIALLFLTKSSADFSRVVTAITFTVGLPMVWLLRSVEVLLLRRAARAGRLDTLRVMVVGASERIKQFMSHGGLNAPGVEIAGYSPLNLRADDPGFRLELQRVLASGRSLNPDCVLLCRAWNDGETLRACITTLAELPAAIHVDSDPHLRTLAGEPVGSMGHQIGFQIIRRPFSKAELTAKRSFDVAGALAAIVLASPLLAIIALLVRIDSPGPVLFRQHRYGYNREPFEILKFRTMRHDGDAAFRQATPDDARITRIGRILRRTNLDELPQLFNVLAGDMSLVGPRPHAVEHDEQFAPLVAHYLRRHRVRPGITGWAQVNGLRGKTDTTDKMEQRVLHDLYYLNNWSFRMDLQIMMMTVLSPSAYRNAG